MDDSGSPTGPTSEASPLSSALARIRAARRRVRGAVVRTPLVPWDSEDLPGPVFLKLENLQPTGSFKVRGALNALAFLRPSRLARGVCTCSAGNMAQALAWAARRKGIPCAVVMPDSAPETKVAGVRRLGAEVISVPWD